jgi:GTPase SAR1 family protein
LIVPGTTISLTLMPTYIEVRDKGIVKKKIPLKGKSYDDISLELKKYFRYLGKRLAPGVLEEILDRIGLPRARRVVHEPVYEPKPKPEQIIEKLTPDAQAEPAAVPESEIKIVKPSKKKEKKKDKAAAKFIQSPGVSADEKGSISVDDFDDIADALKAVEELSDSFMAGVKEPFVAKEPSDALPKEEKKEGIRISLEGQEEIVASGNTYVRAPEIETLTGETSAEAKPEMVELVAETIDEEADGEVEKKVSPQITPAHQIKPIVDCKALLLGETGVGKRSLKSKAGIMPLIINEETNEVSQYIYHKVFDGANHRVNLNVWSFDLAVQAKLPRKEFYTDAEVIIIVYAASDRWSFESVDFWLREASISCENNLPLVIVGNKTDLRTEGGDDSGEEPVSFEEGFQFAEELAKKLTTGEELHPVAFIETSCLTGENTEAVFKTAANLFENTLQK